jgi:hypothetical protein
MLNNEMIVGKLVVDLFKPSGKWSQTLEVEVTAEDLQHCNNYEPWDYIRIVRCKLNLPDVLGKRVNYYTWFIRIEDQHPEDCHFCRYLVKPEEQNALKD